MRIFSRIITGLSVLVCSLGLSLLPVAYYRVGTLLGHTSISLYGWILVVIGVCLAVVEFKSERGFLVSPLASIIVMQLAFLMLSFYSKRYPIDIVYLTVQAGIVFVGIGPILYALAVVVGIPSVLVLRRLELTGGLHYALAGISVGLLLGLAVRLIVAARVATVIMHGGGPPVLYSPFRYMLFGVIVILPAYLCFWLFGIRRGRS